MRIKSTKSIDTSKVIYKLVVDLDNLEKRTVFSHTNINVVDNMLDKLVLGDCKGTSLDESDIENIKGMSIVQVIETPADSIIITRLDNTQQIAVELCTVKVDN